MTTLLLLHGLAATGSAWDALRAACTWDGPVLSPDLPGHGAARRLPAYDVPATARALAEDLGGGGLSGPVAVLGHSWGGAVGTALSAHLDVTAVAAVGVKVAWSEEDVARFAALAARPAKAFGTREEALERHLVMSGLVGQDPQGQASGVVEAEDGWRLALDPAALAQRSPDLAGLVAAAQGRGTRVLLLRGEHDQLVSRSDLDGCGAPAVDLVGLGHNAHVEDPAALWTAVSAHLAAPGG